MPQQTANLEDNPTTVMVEIKPDQDAFDWSGDTFFGIPVEDFGSTLSGWLRLIHPSDQYSAISLFRKTMKRGVRSFEIRQQDSEGTYHWVTFTYVVKVDLANQTKRIIGTLSPPHREQCPNELKADHDRLTLLNQELKEFAYAASHDLQEPMRTISAFADLLNDDYRDRLDEEGREYLAFIREATVRLQQLISDLLAYSRLNSADGHFDQLDLNGVFNEVFQNLNQKLADTSPQIQIGALPTVSGDRSRLVRLFQNLISNALKFSRPDQTPYIKIDAKEEPDHWHIIVSDNGIGIPAEQRQRVFGIFFRLHSQHTHPGTGIGLAICAKIVNHHGGKIWAEESDMGGTAIHLTLLKVTHQNLENPQSHRINDKS